MDARRGCDTSGAPSADTVIFYTTYTYDEFLRTRDNSHKLYRSFDNACDALQKQVARYCDVVPHSHEELKCQVDKYNYVVFCKHEDTYFIIRALTVVD